MATIVIDNGQLGARLRSDASGIPKVLRNALFSAGQRGKAFILDKTPVDRGILRNAWRVVKLSDGIEIINDQPYAGVMEQGARPFKIGRAGIEALQQWVMRKLLNSGAALRNAGKIKKAKYLPGDIAKTRAQQHKGLVKSLLEEEALSIAWAIAKTFEKVGIKGRRFVYNNLPKLALLMDEEINRYLGDFFNRAMGDKE